MSDSTPVVVTPVHVGALVISERKKFLGLAYPTLCSVTNENRLSQLISRITSMRPGPPPLYTSFCIILGSAQHTASSHPDFSVRHISANIISSTTPAPANSVSTPYPTSCRKHKCMTLNNFRHPNGKQTNSTLPTMTPTVQQFPLGLSRE